MKIKQIWGNNKTDFIGLYVCFFSFSELADTPEKVNYYLSKYYLSTFYYSLLE